MAVAGLMLLTCAASAAPRPTLKLEPPTVNGGLDPDVVAPVVAKAVPALLACYKAKLAKTPGVDATETLMFAIAPDGKVGDTDAATWDDAFSACLTAVAAKLKFPASHDGAAVAYKLVYASGVAAKPEPAPDPGPVYAQLTGDSPGMGAGEPPTPSSTLFLRSAAVTGQLAPLAVRRALKRHRAVVAYCYEKALFMTPAMANTRGFTLQFTIRGDGAVRASTVTGAVDPELAECSADAVAKIQFPKPKDGHEVTVSAPVTYILAFPAAK